MRTQTGTPFYASPEVWKDRPYDNRSDIWSLGCVLYEMCGLNPPFRAANMNALYTKVLKGIYEPIPSRYSTDLSMMVRACLQVAPLARPNCSKILSIPYCIKNMPEDLKIDIELQKDNLLNTIKVPRNLGQITERLPKPQY